MWNFYKFRFVAISNGCFNQSLPNSVHQQSHDTRSCKPNFIRAFATLRPVSVILCIWVVGGICNPPVNFGDLYVKIAACMVIRGTKCQCPSVFLYTKIDTDFRDILPMAEMVQSYWKHVCFNTMNTAKYCSVHCVKTMDRVWFTPHWESEIKSIRFLKVPVVFGCILYWSAKYFQLIL